jgi:hypothetical protein
LRLTQEGPKHGKAIPPEALEAMMRAVPRCQEALARNANVQLTLTRFALTGAKA